MLFEKTYLLNKAHQLAKEYTLKFSGSFNNLLTHSVAAQYLLLQPLPTRPFLFFLDLSKRIPAISNFVYELICTPSPFLLLFNFIWSPVSCVRASHLLRPYVSDQTHSVMFCLLQQSCQTFFFSIFFFFKYGVAKNNNLKSYF